MHKLKYLLVLTVIYLIINLVIAEEVEGYKSYKGYKIFSILPKNDKDLKKISRILKNPYIDVWKSTNIIGSRTDVMVPPQMQEEFTQKLNRNELIYNITLDNVQRIINEERQQQRKNSVATKDGTRNHILRHFIRYFRYPEVSGYLNYLKFKYPNLVRIINIGKSNEGRPLNVIHISSEFRNLTKPTIFIMGGAHAREWIGPAQVLHIIYELVERNAKNKHLIEHIDWYLLPTLNPDGYEYTFEEDRMWRKNRRRVSKTCIGVDTNRNFDYKWKSESKCGDTFPGYRSFSEPETIAIKKFAENIKYQLKLYLTFHSYSEIILYPWSYTTKEVPNNYNKLKKIAKNLEKILGHDYTSGVPGNILFYNAYGSSMDWFKGHLNVDLVFAIELSPGQSGEIDGNYYGFALPVNKISETVSDGFKAVKYLAKYIIKSYKFKHV